MLLFAYIYSNNTLLLKCLDFVCQSAISKSAVLGSVWQINLLVDMDLSGNVFITLYCSSCFWRLFQCPYQCDKLSIHGSLECRNREPCGCGSSGHCFHVSTPPYAAPCIQTAWSELASDGLWSSAACHIITPFSDMVSFIMVGSFSFFHWPMW